MKFVSAIFAASLSIQAVSGFAPSLSRPVFSPQTALKMATLTQDELKQMVGYKSVDDYVKSGMVVGLGTGSTAYFAVERLGQLLESGELKDIVAIPTSVRTKEQAESLKIPLVTLDTHSKLDVAIDGADEVDPDFNLVKGGGGALLREKMVEVCADKFIVIGTYFSPPWNPDGYILCGPKKFSCSDFSGFTHYFFFILLTILVLTHPLIYGYFF